MADSNLAAQAAPTTAVAKPHLELMPPELFEVMAQCLDPRDLFSLRRVSKQCKDKAQKTFLEAWFSEGSLRINDEDSLKEMLKLVDNPVYGPALRKIVIFIDEWIDWPRDSRHARYENGLEKQKKFRDSGKASHLLTSIFSKARKVASVTEICITSSPHPPELEHVLSKLPAETLKYWVYGVAHDDDPSSTVLIFESLWLSDLSIQILSQTGPGRNRDINYNLPIHVLALDPRGIDVCKNVLKSVESISMHIEFPDVKDTNAARQFLRCMPPCLKPLGLYLDEVGIRWDPDFLDHDAYDMDMRAPELFLQDLSLPSLRTVELEGSELRADTLVSFIKRLPSLEKISLRDMTITAWPQAIGDWQFTPRDHYDEDLASFPTAQDILRIMAGFQAIDTDENSEFESKCSGWYQ